MTNAKPVRPFPSLALAIAVALAAGIATPTFAQSAMERAEQRRAKHAQKQQQPEEQAQEQAVEARYPQATREEPETTASAKLSPRLQKMFDAYDEDDGDTVVQIADEILANPDANAYEHAIAARIAGAALLNADNARARGYIEKAVQFDGLNNNDHYESMFIAAQLQLQEGDYAASLATIDKFLSETKSQEPEHLVVKGNALYRLERYQEAAAVLEQAIKASPSPDPTWQQLLMGAYAETGQADQAARLAEQIGGANPGDTNAQLNLAATYMQAGDDAKAGAILEQLRSGGKLTSETDYRNLYAIYLNAEGKEKQAAAVINEGLEKGILKPDHGTYNALAQAYWFAGDNGPAIEAYQKAAPLAKDGETYLNLARALNNEGRSAEARKAAEQALAKGVAKPEDARRIIANNP